MQKDVKGCMMTVEEVRSALSDRNLSTVSRATGLSYQTVWSIANDPTRDGGVKYRTLRTLDEYLTRRQS